MHQIGAKAHLKQKIMKQLNILLSILISSIIFISCSTVTIIGNTYPPKHQNEQIDAYFTKMPTRDYVDVAIIDTFLILSDQRAFDDAKKEARRLGADAIIVLANSSTSMSNTVSSTSNSATTTTNHADPNAGYKIVAIKYVQK